MNVLWVRRHVFIGIILVCHVAGIASIALIIYRILIDRSTLHLLLIIKTIIEHQNLSSACSRLTYGRYAADFLLGMYWLVRAVMLHFIVAILPESARALPRYYHLLLHARRWTHAVSLKSSTWYSQHAAMLIPRVMNAWEASHVHGKFWIWLLLLYRLDNLVVIHIIDIFLIWILTLYFQRLFDWWELYFLQAITNLRWENVWNEKYLYWTLRHQNSWCNSSSCSLHLPSFLILETFLNYFTVWFSSHFVFSFYWHWSAWDLHMLISLVGQDCGQCH